MCKISIIPYWRICMRIRKRSDVLASLLTRALLSWREITPYGTSDAYIDLNQILLRPKLTERYILLSKKLPKSYQCIYPMFLFFADVSLRRNTQVYIIYCENKVFIYIATLLQSALLLTSTSLLHQNYS